MVKICGNCKYEGIGNCEEPCGSCRYLMSWKPKEEKTVKPPLGVTPKDIFLEHRINELCRALYEYTHTDYTVKDKFELLMLWASELNNRLQERYFK